LIWSFDSVPRVNALPDKVRVFVALRMSAQVEDALAGFVATLRGLSSGISWTPRANLHLILRFLGDRVPAEKLERLDAALEQIATTTSPFAIGVHGGIFPNPNRPRVIWVGLQSDVLIQLAARVENAAVSAGFEPEQRDYTPHVTIGRIRDPRAWRALRTSIAEAAHRDFGATQVDSMALYQSRLGSQPTYIQLAAYLLSSSCAGAESASPPAVPRHR
jgi:RNA 2',3'-cyclic 3'-phosphodiesterase